MALPSPSASRLSEGGVALVVNARARKFRRGALDAKRLRAMVELHGRCFEPHTLRELSQVAAEIRSRDPGLVGICGGDGTYQKTITALVEAYGEHPLPMLLPLAGGTFNVLTSNLGLRGTAPKMLARAMSEVRASARSGARLRTTTVPILEIADLRAGKRELGFIFANGVVSRIIARYCEGPASTARAARVFSESVGGFMMQTPAGRELVKRHHAQVSVDGRPLPERSFLGLVAGTIQPMVLGFTPFAAKKRRLNSFNYALSMVEASKVIGMLPALLRGKLWSSHPGLRNATARELKIVSDEGFILDGEVHPSGIQRDLRIRVGPRLKFLRPG
jgi:diacylglycerol kinase family enzyme